MHISGTPIALETILERLRPGDIATHIFNGYEHGILDGTGRVRGVVREAVARGVVVYVGHAGVHFDVNVARAALEQDLPPTTLSTDLVRPFVPRRTYDLLGVMSTFLALGMPLHDIIRSVTDAPARAIGRGGELGSLAPGAEGDAAVPASKPATSRWGHRRPRSHRPPAVRPGPHRPRRPPLAPPLTPHPARRASRSAPTRSPAS